MIQVENLSYSIGNKKLLQDISFNIQSGEMLAILGANGAGKSTLLKLLCKDMQSSHGNIFFHGRNIKEYSLVELAKMRSVLMQQNTLSLSFKAKELVLMGRYPYFEHQPSEVDIQIVNTVMQETGILDFADRDYNTLSGGEQQRVQLARVLAQIYDSKAGFLFLDEPTNGLDMLYQQQILTIAKNMADRGYSVICILHDINFASRYADKILILKDGKKVAFGSPEEVINCENIHTAFNIQVSLFNHQEFACPLVIPINQKFINHS